MASRNANKITERELADSVDLKLNYLENKKLSENITVKGDCHGTFVNGEIITKGTRIHDVIKGILDDTYEFPYKFPTLELTGAESNIEVGKVVSMTIEPKYHQNDAGPIKRFVLERSVNGGKFVVLYDTDHLITHTEPSIKIVDSVDIITFKGTVWFGEGEIKYDKGQKIEGHVEAGDISTLLTISGIRKCFYGAESGIRVPVQNSKQVRDLPNSTVFDVDGAVITMEIPANTSRITIAYPGYIRDIQEITSKKLGYDVKDVFEVSNIRVKGANNHDDISYKVYTYIPDKAYPSDDVYTIHIADGNAKVSGTEELVSLIDMSNKLADMEERMRHAVYYK